MSWYESITPIELLANVEELDELNRKFRQTSNPELLRTIIENYHHIINHPLFPNSRSEFQGDIFIDAGLAYWSVYLLSKEHESFGLAYSFYNKALSVLSPDDSLRRSRALYNKSAILITRYEIDGNIQFLDDALKECADAINEMPESMPKRATYLKSYSDYSVLRFRATSQRIDLDSAIESLEIASTIPEQPAWHLGNIIASLGDRYADKYRAVNDFGYIVQAVSHYDRLFNFVEQGLAVKPEWILSQSSYIYEQFIVKDDLGALDRAISFIQAYQNQINNDHYHIASILSNLGLFLLQRYIELGNDRDLTDAYDNCMTAFHIVDDEMPGHPNAPIIVLNMARCLRHRFLAFGNPVELHDAIQLHKNILQYLNLDGVWRGMTESGYGECMLARFLETKKRSDVEEAIQRFRNSLSYLSPNSPDYYSASTSLAWSFLRAFEVTSESHFLDRAIDRFQALIRDGISASAQYDISTGLCTALLHRYYLEENLLDLDSVIVLSTQAAREGSPRHPGWHTMQNICGVAFGIRYHLQHDIKDYDRAVNAFRLLCSRTETVRIGEILDCGRNWALMAIESEKWPHAVEALNSAIAALDKSFIAQLLRSKKENILREYQWVYMLAAYSQIQTGDINSAILTIESGRAKLLTEVLRRNRIDLEKLREKGHEDLYAYYRRASEHINELERVEIYPSNYESGVVQLLTLTQVLVRLGSKVRGFNYTTEMQKARESLDRTVTAIKEFPEYRDLFEPFDNLEEIRNILAPSPQDIGVYLIVTRVGGIAILIHAGGIEWIPLKITMESLYEELADLKDGRLVGGYLYNQRFGGYVKEDLDRLLPNIGDKIVRPVVERIAHYISVAEGLAPTLTLITTGILNQIPLHAAQYTFEGKEHILLDHFSIRYAPSAQVLGYCSELLSNYSTRPPTSFIMGVPEKMDPKWESLPHSPIEISSIATSFEELFPDKPTTVFHQQLVGNSDVIRQIEHVDYLHFACHAEYEVSDPLKSGVILSSGKRLTLAEIMFSNEGHHPWRLVVLSACQTAVADILGLPEEDIGLPVGFLQSGAIGVIGTLWPVKDLSTSILMIRFYQYHLNEESFTLEGPMNPIESLNKAQNWLKNSTNLDLFEFIDNLYRKAAKAELRVIFRDIRSEFRDLALNAPNEKRYSHPYYWAPFAFYGA